MKLEMQGNAGILWKNPEIVSPSQAVPRIIELKDEIKNTHKTLKYHSKTRDYFTFPEKQIIKLKLIII